MIFKITVDDNDSNLAHLFVMEDVLSLRGTRHTGTLLALCRILIVVRNQSRQVTQNRGLAA